MKRKAITIRDDQAELVEANNLDLNKIVQDELDEQMKKGKVIIGLDLFDVEKLKYEAMNPSPKPALYIGTPKIHEPGKKKSAIVVRPPGWNAQPPNYPKPFRTDISINIKPERLIYSYREPEIDAIIPKNIIHGAGELEEELIILPVAERKTSPARIHDFSRLIF